MVAVPNKNAEELQKKLKALIPLNALQDKDREQLLEQVSVQSAKKDEFLFTQGDIEARNIYLLYGAVELLQDKKVVDSLAADADAARYALAHQLPRKLSCRAKMGGAEYISVESYKLGELVEKARESAFTVGEVQEEESDWMSQLLMSPVCQLIPPANIQNIIIRMEELKVAKGEAVVNQGDDGEYFYLIHRGSCVVTCKADDNAEPEELAHLNAGDSFGEEALLSDSKRSGTVTMLTDGILQRLSKEDFITFIKHPLAKEVSYPEADKIIAAGGVWLDVRDAEEYQAGHQEKSINLPIQSLRFQSPSLATDNRYVVYCANGRKSAAAAFLLMEQGLDVAILKGGYSSAPPATQSDQEAPAKRQEAAETKPKPDKVDGSGSTDDLAKLTKERDEALARVDALENRMSRMRDTFEATQSELLAKIEELQQVIAALKEKGAQAGGGGAAGESPDRVIVLEKEIRGLKSENLVLEGELEILMAASEDSDQARTEEVDDLKKQLSVLQKQLDA
ncbi:hypothetical protein MNBD_GAMMA26-229 [hydrothermal vent metagenome]|uniref:Cyclic nucleotide-binding domain-containing protein n=1 Tax=hydrothermal vent metagenome TaxID=652676 RepID=A0A3B1AKK2_9ZZZZ